MDSSSHSRQDAGVPDARGVRFRILRPGVTGASYPQLFSYLAVAPEPVFDYALPFSSRSL